MVAEAHSRARANLTSGGVVNGRERPSKTYGKGRRCEECDKPISMYNKHSTCWEHTARETYTTRGIRINAVGRQEILDSLRWANDYG
jgi:hypothetical protein